MSALFAASGFFYVAAFVLLGFVFFDDDTRPGLKKAALAVLSCACLGHLGYTVSVPGFYEFLDYTQIVHLLVILLATSLLFLSVRFQDPKFGLISMCFVLGLLSFLFFKGAREFPILEEFRLSTQNGLYRWQYLVLFCFGALGVHAGSLSLLGLVQREVPTQKFLAGLSVVALPVLGVFARDLPSGFEKITLMGSMLLFFLVILFFGLGVWSDAEEGDAGWFGYEGEEATPMERRGRLAYALGQLGLWLVFLSLLGRFFFSESFVLEPFVTSFSGFVIVLTLGEVLAGFVRMRDRVEDGLEQADWYEALSIEAVRKALPFLLVGIGLHLAYRFNTSGSFVSPAIYPLCGLGVFYLTCWAWRKSESKFLPQLSVLLWVGGIASFFVGFFVWPGRIPW